ncbi:MAG: glycoside hydrolase family 3 protein, partial [Prevotellaceae bacterium]|nr:glycoside hydrolase family 3 protein [Prevotellaceae bacterium]
MKHFFYLTSLVLLLASCQKQVWTNPNLSPERRAELLLQELTLEEKVTLMTDVSDAIPRLGIPTYNWWNEALHGVARAGLATVFPQSIGMAASFDQDAVFDVFT